ncbi:MAG: ABC transporter permease [Bacteroidota bacterium]|nr:ABC transporter permease [Bacteroidota bacterium]
MNNISLQESSHEHWTEVISPRAHLFDLKLGEVWRYRDLLLLFVKRDFIATYKQTVLGPVWHIIQPLLTTIMFLIVFGSIANIPTDGIEPILFYMSSITIWNYFSACLTGTSNTFVANAGIFGKVYFPRLVIPLSIVISNIVKLGIQFLLLLAMMVFFAVKRGHFYFGISWLLIPVLVMVMAAMGLGLGIIISSLTTKYRDFTVLIGFGVQLLMYATPVAYPMSYIAARSHYAWLIKLNPLSSVVEGFRYAIFNTGTFSVNSFLYSCVATFIFVIVGLLLFNKVEKSFMDTV